MTEDPQVLYDVTSVCVENLRHSFKMGGMSRVVRAWAMRMAGTSGFHFYAALPGSLAAKGTGKLLGPISRERVHGLSSRSDSLLEFLFRHSGKDRGILSRGCGYLSTHAVRLLHGAGMRSLPTCFGTTSRWIYHAVIPARLPARIPDGCVPLISIYDVIPLIFTDTYPQEFRRELSQTVAMARHHDAHLLVNSVDTKHSIVAFFDYPAHRVHVVPLGCDPPASLAQPAHPNAGRPYCLYVASSGQRRKNIPRLIDAFARFVRRNGIEADLLITGSGTDAHQARANRAVEGASAAIRCLGAVPEAVLESLYAHARIGLYVSLYEGFGLPVLEYMARNVPVICGGYTSLAEVGGDAVERADVLDEVSLCDAIERLWFDDTRRARLISAGQAQVMTATWDESFSALKACYRKVLSEPRRVEVPSVP
jgi:glycosyltransferase involved in cell wall biosynthesis